MLPSRLRYCLSATCVSGLLAYAGCGPSELPAFANPPPEDASVHDTHEHDDADAGESSRDG